MSPCMTCCSTCAFVAKNAPLRLSITPAVVKGITLTLADNVPVSDGLVEVIRSGTVRWQGGQPVVLMLASHGKP